MEKDNQVQVNDNFLLKENATRYRVIEIKEGNILFAPLQNATQGVIKVSKENFAKSLNNEELIINPSKEKANEIYQEILKKNEIDFSIDATNLQKLVGKMMFNKPNWENKSNLLKSAEHIHDKLPTLELKEYGLMNENNSFNNKLSANDVKRFLEGATIIADNKNDRVTFQLSNDTAHLKVQQFHRDKAIESLLRDSQREIQYVKEIPFLFPKDVGFGNTFKLKSIDRNEDLLVTSVRKDKNGVPTKVYFNDKNGNQFNIGFDEFKKNAFDLRSLTAMETIKAFVYDEKTKSVKEYDLLKDTKELTQTVAETQKDNEVNRYKVELQKLMSFIQDKIDKFPELGKQLTENLNIVSNEMHSVNSISTNLNKKAEKSEIEYDVNDPDLYQDANREREENEEQEIKEESKRGRRR